MRNALSIFSPSFEDGLLQSIGNGFSNFTNRASSLPCVDIKQTDDAYLLDMELPGLDEKDIDVSLHDHTLTISSKHEENKEDKKEEDGVQYLIKERSSRSFTRRFSLPEDIDTDKINANFSKGILEVKIPRKPDSKPRTINVSSK